jgi:hypothetical protein
MKSAVGAFSILIGQPVGALFAPFPYAYRCFFRTLRGAPKVSFTQERIH